VVAEEMERKIGLILLLEMVVDIMERKNTPMGISGKKYTNKNKNYSSK
jgi:hypothetical protein